MGFAGGSKIHGRGRKLSRHSCEAGKMILRKSDLAQANVDKSDINSRNCP